MTIELKTGLLGAFGIHALLLAGLTYSLQHNTLDVISAPSSLEVALVTIKTPPKVEVPKELPKVTQAITPKPIQEEQKAKQTSQSNLKTGALTKAYPKEQLNKPPTYPRAARRRGIEGSLLLKVFITKNGLVERAEVLQSSGSDMLDRSALESVQQWQFQPARQFGVSVDSTLEVPFVFRLDDA